MKMEHSKYWFKYDPKAEYEFHIFRNDEDITKDIRYENIIRDMFFEILKLRESLKAKMSNKFDT